MSSRPPARVACVTRGAADATLLRELIERHLRFTGSTRALSLLDAWQTARSKFVKIFPNEYKRALGELHERQVAGLPVATAQREVA